VELKGLDTAGCVLVLGSNLPTIALAYANLLYEKDSLSLMTPARKRDCRQILSRTGLRAKGYKNENISPVLAIASCGSVPDPGGLGPARGR
jgi:hypothetical protein